MSFINRNKRNIFVLLCAFVAMGCSKMNDPIAEYIKDGERVYSTRVDSLQAFSGNKRVKLTWQLPANNSASKVVVYWNNKSESREIPLEARTGNKFEYILTDMPEAPYLFSVVTYDVKGNTSIKNDINAIVYGEVFQNSLLNRAVTLNKVLPSQLKMIWTTGDISQASIELKYTNSSNVDVTTILTPSLDPGSMSIIQNVNLTKPISYRTVYKPATSIDSFIAPWSVVTIP
jgi:hypothetical protein